MPSETNEQDALPRLWLASVRTNVCFRACVGISVAVCSAAAFVGSARAQTAPGPEDAPSTYARYISPSECFGAVRRIGALFWRRNDTVRVTQRDTLLPRQVRAASACGARFSAATTAEDELPSLMALSLVAGATARADSAAARYIAAAATPQAAAWRRYEVVRRWMEARPVNVRAAMTLVAQMDTSPAMAAPRMLSYNAIAAHAVAHYNLTLLDTLAPRLAAAIVKLSMDDRLTYIGQAKLAYEILARHAAEREGGAAAVAVVERAKARIGTLNPYVNNELAASADAYGSWNTAPGPLTPEFWFNAGTGIPTRPAPGKTSLLVFFFLTCPTCDDGYDVARRLAREYEARGLEVTLVSSLMGYVRNEAVPDAKTEAERTRDFVIDSLKLPGALLLLSTKTEPMRDGRLARRSGSGGDLYQGGKFGLPGAVLVTKSGVIRVSDKLSAESEAMWRAHIEAEL